MSNLTVRILSAVAMFSLALLAFWANYWTRALFILAILVAGAWEMGRMVDRKFSAPSLGWLTALLAALLLLPHALNPLFPGTDFSPWLSAAVLLTVTAFVLAGFHYLPIESMAPWMALQIGGCLFLGVWSAAFFSLITTGPGLKAVLPLLFLVLAMGVNDSGAYFAGRALGRRKLSPEISPKKTIEGAIGGLICTALLAFLAGPLMLPLDRLPALGLGVLLAFTGVVGDLLESTVKRYAGFKDSSGLIPGHGGVLDRFDSMLFSAPFAAWYLELFAT